MGLRFNGQWRFSPPPDGYYFNSTIPTAAVWEFVELIKKLSNQGDDRWETFEHFKRAFGVSGRSSSEGWAEYDLERAMDQCAENAPAFIEQLFNGLEQLRNVSGWFVPDEAFLNAVLAKHRIGYEIRSPDLVAREDGARTIPVVVPEPSMAEQARGRIQRSLSRAEELLLQSRPREAVQESLWLLESVATAFRGLKTESGRVEGSYFNQLVRDLRSKKTGTTLEQVLTWVSAMHGYLSSPTGGGVRHGSDLKSGIELDQAQGQLFCNLTRSYVQYLLLEHDAIDKRRKE